MTVDELIIALRQLPPTLPVLIEAQVDGFDALLDPKIPEVIRYIIERNHGDRWEDAKGEELAVRL